MKIIANIVIGMIVLVGSSATWANEMRIVNIRIGQGDATLIQGPRNAATGQRINVLFDAGNTKNRDAGNILQKVLDDYGVKILDYVVISHDHQDHLGGLITGDRHGKSALLGFNNTPGCPGNDDGDSHDGWEQGKEFVVPDADEIGECDDIEVLNWVDYGEAQMRQGKEHIEKYNGLANSMGLRHVLKDQESVDDFIVSLGEGATMKAMAAYGYVRGRSEEEGRVEKVNTPNEMSLSMLISYKKFDFLVSGDLIGKGTSDSTNAKVEDAVGKSINDLGVIVDILHVNHHGANNGSAKKFLNDIKPNVAIISAGNDNGYKHPTNAVLQRLHQANVYRTVLTSFGEPENRTREDVRDRLAVYQDDVVITTNGDNYYISTSRGYHSDKNCVLEPKKCSRGL